MFKTSRGTAGPNCPTANFKNDSRKNTPPMAPDETPTEGLPFSRAATMAERGESIRESVMDDGTIIDNSIYRHGSTASILPGILDDSHYSHNGHAVTPGIQPAGESGKPSLKHLLILSASGLS
jgi:hypothetical protein